MKIYLNNIQEILLLPVIFAFILLPLPSYAANINYQTDGNTKIDQQIQDIHTFILEYTKNKLYFSQLQRQQIESQYNGTLQSLESIQSRLKTDSGQNLQNDYAAITTGVYTYQEKLPELYSETFLFKSIYLYQKLITINTSLAPIIVNEVPKISYQQALNNTENMAASLTAMSNDIQDINASYSTLVSISGSQNPESTFSETLKTIEAKQQDIQKQNNLFNASFSNLINLL